MEINKRLRHVKQPLYCWSNLGGIVVDQMRRRDGSKGTRGTGIWKAQRLEGALLGLTEGCHG